MHNWQDLHLKKEIPISQQIHKLFFVLCIVKQNQDLNKENAQHSLFRHILPNTQIFSEYVQYNETVKTRLWWWTFMNLCSYNLFKYFMVITQYSSSGWLKTTSTAHTGWELLKHNWLFNISLTLNSYKQFSYLQDWTVGCFLFPCRPNVPATRVKDEGQMLHVSNNPSVYTRKCCIKISKK